MDRPETLDFSLWVGKHPTKAPWYQERAGLASSRDRRRTQWKSGSASGPHIPRAHGAGRG